MVVNMNMQTMVTDKTDDKRRETGPQTILMVTKIPWGKLNVLLSFILRMNIVFALSVKLELEFTFFVKKNDVTILFNLR